jgi:hypothetical protein
LKTIATQLSLTRQLLLCIHEIQTTDGGVEGVGSSCR